MNIIFYEIILEFYNKNDISKIYNYSENILLIKKCI